MSEQALHAEPALYSTADGTAQFFLKMEDGNLWLSQSELADLFHTSVSNINTHINNVFEEGELSKAQTLKDKLIVQTEGTRQVRRAVKLYNLDMILAVGYRIKSPRGIQFRRWAAVRLNEFLIKGFVFDDARLKDPEAWDYFNELLESIRDVRTSEKRFYQKIRDLFALSADYRDDVQAVDTFFAEVQNKMLFSVTGKDAADLIIERADVDQPDRALQAWQGGRAHKTDVIVAKNYLQSDEIQQLNRIATMFLDYAEDRAEQRKNITLLDWRKYVDNFLEFNERPLLKGNGRVSHDSMVKLAHERYEEFDAKRRGAEALRADVDDIAELETIAQNKKVKREK
ncbi:RhuM family protein [Herbaspirillum sp. RV1423]|uniref:RhuM family protein n=1 Tax=Herbaspirillum sp. RV1423 TaxID=1443993 RepID=UPI0004B130D1|nr:RhuM family protein [Herbaspirillum sp. RV1423]